MARGPYRAPGRLDVPSSNGAPTTATSTPSRAAGSMTSRWPANVAPIPAWPGESPRTPSCCERSTREHPTRCTRLERGLRSGDLVGGRHGGVELAESGHERRVDVPRVHLAPAELEVGSGAGV